jgi:hypothetical protein
VYGNPGAQLRRLQFTDPSQRPFLLFSLRSGNGEFLPKEECGIKD